ncbi:MAG: type I glutamate--ammonia ligase [Methanosarcinaceae archaeon]
MTDIEEARAKIKRSGVRWIETHFVDIDGRLRSMSKSVGEYINGDALDIGTNFDGSSVGLAPVDASDMLLVPDPATFLTLPWKQPGGPVGRVMCDIYDPVHSHPFEGCPRTVASKVTNMARDMGFARPTMAPELEFMVFRSMNEAMGANDFWSKDVQKGLGAADHLPNMTDLYSGTDYLARASSGYLRAEPEDTTAQFRNEFSSTLMELGVPLRYHHHELGANQIEIEVKMMDGPLVAGDTAVLYKYVARMIARKHGLIATFMPKPVMGDAGSGMHLHMELFKKDRSAFYDADDETHLTQTARYFIGGLLDHARGICAFTNPTVNSYRRMVPHFEAPMDIAWSPANRSAMVRIPSTRGDTRSIHVEARQSDTSANPYYCYSLLLAAGLDGIKRKIEPPEAFTGDIFRLTDAEKRSHGIDSLPTSLNEALEALDSDDLARNILGRDTVERFTEKKMRESEYFSAYVSALDFYQYFDI